MARARERFQYKRPEVEGVREVRDASGSMYKSIIKDSVSVKMFKVQPTNLIRFLPPTWENATYMALPTIVHYSIGGDGDTYLCPKEMAGVYRDIGQTLPVPDDCAICDARTQATQNGEGELADSLKPTKRWSAYIIDRQKQDEGVHFWAVPHTVNKDISTRMIGEKESGVLPVDDPDNGFDISFSKEGQLKQTKYLGINIARNPVPLTLDEELFDQWLTLAIEHPIPSILNFYSYAEMERALKGQKVRDDASPLPSAPPIQNLNPPPVAPTLNPSDFEVTLDTMSRKELLEYTKTKKFVIEGDTDEMGKMELVSAIQNIQQQFGSAERVKIAPATEASADPKSAVDRFAQLRAEHHK